MVDIGSTIAKNVCEIAIVVLDEPVRVSLVVNSTWDYVLCFLKVSQKYMGFELCVLKVGHCCMGRSALLFESKPEVYGFCALRFKSR